MSRVGLLPRTLAAVHPKFKTPWVNTVLVGIGACLASGFMSLKVLSNVTNLGSLTAFAIVCITVIYLRFAEPKLARPFKVPLYPVVPILGAIMCALLILSLWANPDTRGFFIPYLIVGVLVYFLFGAWNSNLRKGIKASGHDAAGD
jgi:basic amino acid/polyamine antiporter, APA family